MTKGEITITTKTEEGEFLRSYFANWCANKLENPDKVNNFLRKYRLPKLVHSRKCRQTNFYIKTEPGTKLPHRKAPGFFFFWFQKWNSIKLSKRPYHSNAL